MSSHHPNTELLFDYATGGADLPVSLALATHLSFCPRCRAEAAWMETVGGALIDTMDGEAVSGESLSKALNRLDQDPQESSTPAETLLDARTKAVIPPPLRPYLPTGLDTLRWRRRGRLREATIPTGAKGYRVSLFRLGPNKAAPSHGHSGHEYTVVLSGSFTESGEHFCTGDFAYADESCVHVQVGDEHEGCLCLAVHDAPVRLTGALGALVNPFLKI